jgi:hypothetical protein
LCSGFNFDEDGGYGGFLRVFPREYIISLYREVSGISLHTLQPSMGRDGRMRAGKKRPLGK